tara:strand:- start:1147 stop:1455 length:309 start_codon:yes stop_codon:yes gene_type:complete
MSSDNEEHFKVLRKVGEQDAVSQRKLSKDLGMSLGKINYCLKALKTKGLIKIKNFKNNKKKIGYLYLLTPKGINEKTKITIRFMKIKMQEYETLRKEIEKNK